MVIFNKLRISKDDLNLLINASIRLGKNYRNVYIDRIIIDDQNSYNPNGYSSNPVYTKQVEGDIKNINLELVELDLLRGIKGNLLFIYIITKGVPSPETPCGEDNSISRAILYNQYPFYMNTIHYLKQLGLSCNSECEIPRDFINTYLQFKGIEFAIRTGHYTEAVNLWKRINLKDVKYININKNCYG